MLPFNLKEDPGDKLSRYLQSESIEEFSVASSYNNYNYQTVTYFSSNILETGKVKIGTLISSDGGQADNYWFWPYKYKLNRNSIEKCN